MVSKKTVNEIVLAIQQWWAASAATPCHPMVRKTEVLDLVSRLTRINGNKSYRQTMAAVEQELIRYVKSIS